MPTNTNTKATKATKANIKPAPKRNATKQAAAPKADANAEKLAEQRAFSERVASERVTAAKLVAACNSAAISIPIKSLAAFKRSYKRDVTAHAIGRKPSPRQAAAITVAALSGGKTVSNGATFPRKFDRDGASYAIENGALSDAIASGIVSYDAKTESITIKNAAEISAQIGNVTGLTI